MPDEKLVPFAYSWGYESLLQGSDELRAQKTPLRAELGIPADSWVILFCGRLNWEKSPADLLEAYRRVNLPNKALVFVGDGDLKQDLEDQVDRCGLESVYFPGFKDRNELPNYYAIADVLVLPSHRETWGMVVNEAMCFGLPVIVSDQVGAGIDLVRHGYNGFEYPRGDVDALAGRIQQIAQLPEAESELFGIRSKQMVREWLERDLVQSLTHYLDGIYDLRNGNRGRSAPVGR